jgi:hypothetical protein
VNPLPPAPLTTEDLWIITRCGNVPGYIVQVQHVQGRWIFASDRRDADLMLSLIGFRSLSQSHEQWHIRLASIGIPLEKLRIVWGYA